MITSKSAHWSASGVGAIWPAGRPVFFWFGYQKFCLFFSFFHRGKDSNRTSVPLLTESDPEHPPPSLSEDPFTCGYPALYERFTVNWETVSVYSQLIYRICVCCIVLLNRYWGIVTVPGSFLYKGPGVVGCSLSTFTTSLVTPVSGKIGAGYAGRKLLRQSTRYSKKDEERTLSW